MKAVIATRHNGLLRWLEAHHPELINGAEVLPHITTAEQIRGKVVVGNLPLALAAEAEMVLAPTYEVPAELRGQELATARAGNRVGVGGLHLRAYPL